jgi:pyruvate ferredoxin oxidoreductase alpha subunit
VLSQIEGSRAVARTVAHCRPQVVCAYPISPQTHIVEELARLVSDGRLAAGFMNVESEFAAMSVAIGAAAAGSRTYTATASQGLLYMTEALFNAAGLGLPVVMTVANRAVGAPINIWNDHSDSMSQRDSGWVQLYADSNQSAVDLHVQAYRIAEQLSLPVMVCMDGFVLTHAVEAVDVPEQDDVDAFLPPFVPRQVLDPAAPLTIGAMVGPEAFTEVRYLAHQAHLRALDVIPAVAEEYARTFGRTSGGLLSTYRCDDADTVVLALGSVVGTLQDVVDERRDAGERVGVVGLTTFRPFPYAAVADAVRGARRVIVVERAVELGAGGIVSRDVRTAAPGTAVHTVVAGLGGRPVTRASLHELLAAPELPDLTFLDLRTELLAEVGG